MVTDSIQKAVLDKDFSDLKCAFPESDFFFDHTQSGELQPHSLVSNPVEQIKDSTNFAFNQSVLEYKTANQTFYLHNNNQASIVLKKDIFKMDANEIKHKNWQSALIMQGKWYSQSLHPEISDNEWLNLVKYSFISKVMTPVTSYLVVENEAQKAILKKKQEQVLANNKALDLGEEVQRMSEPNLLILISLLGIVLWFSTKVKLRRLN